MDKERRAKEKAEPFPSEAYQNVSLDDLVVYALFSLEQKNIEGRFENIVAESFELFPEKFYLHGYPEYPDARRVFNAVMRLCGGLPTEGNKLVAGNMKSSFKLTAKGMEKVKDISRILKASIEDQIYINEKIKDIRGKMGRVIYEVEKHALYKEYLRYKEKTEIPETLLRDLLFATMETSHEKLRENMNTLIEYSVLLRRNDIKEFLEFCRKKHKEIFRAN